MDLLTFLENRHSMYAHDIQRIYELQMSAQHPVFVAAEKYADIYEPIRRLAMVQFPRRTSEKKLTSFRISDILSSSGEDASGTRDNETNGNCDSRQIVSSPRQYSEPRKQSCVTSHGVSGRRHDRHSATKHRDVARPWSTSPKHDIYVKLNLARGLPSCGSESDEEIDVEACDDGADGRLKSCSPETDFTVSPLDALVQMSKTAFRGLDNIESQRRMDPSLVNKSHMTKKKRKTRTAFTNQQIYELEKRFLYQKYLTPADRDDISQNLGLTCAQVITWFQNRRAKFKRDIEELKNDVGASNPGTPHAVDNNSSESANNHP